MSIKEKFLFHIAIFFSLFTRLPPTFLQFFRMFFTRLDVVCFVILLATGALGVVHQRWFISGGSSENESLQGEANEDAETERRDNVESGLLVELNTLTDSVG